MGRPVGASAGCEIFGQLDIGKEGGACCFYADQMWYGLAVPGVLSVSCWWARKMPVETVATAPHAPDGVWAKEWSPAFHR